MFQTVPLSIIRSFSLYTQQWYKSYSRIRTDPSRSCSQAVSKPVWRILLLCVQWKTPDDGQRDCPKHVEFYSKNKFQKLVHLVGFIIKTELYLLHTRNNEFDFCIPGHRVLLALNRSLNVSKSWSVCSVCGWSRLPIVNHYIDWATRDQTFVPHML